MTVIVWDGKTLAADKMAMNLGWGFSVTKIRKLEDGTLLAFVGEDGPGLALVNWYQNGADLTQYPKSQDDENRWARLIVVKDRNIITYDQSPVAIPYEGPTGAWGSGRDFALGALAMGADARQAVEIASRLCVSCGLGIDAFDI